MEARIRSYEKMFVRYRRLSATTKVLLLAFMSISFFTVSSPAQESQPASFSFENENVARQLSDALSRAKEQKNEVLIILGASWCKWCRAMDDILSEPEMSDLLNEHYQVVKIDIGGFDQNLDVAAFFKVDLKETGIPLFVVMDGDGNVRDVKQNDFFVESGEYNTQLIYDSLQNEVVAK